MPITNSNILIIEHSIPVNLLLTQYLKRMGFSQILVCETAESGIKAFEELALEKRNPIVFLGYHLPDNTADKLIPKLFSIAPDVKIIIETALEKNDVKIRNLFSMGVFHYLKKPLRLSSVNHVIETIQKEVSEFSNMGIDGRKVLGMIKSIRRISLVRLAEYCDSDSKSLLSFLRKEQEKSIIQEINEIYEIGCRDCKSVNSNQLFTCRNCTSQNFRRINLIEHYNCGNVSPQDTYDNEKCPQCKNKIKTLGVDYRLIKNLYICNECNERFSEPSQIFLCNKCGSKFLFDEINWIKSPMFCFNRTQMMVSSSTTKSEFSQLDLPDFAKIQI